MCTALRNYCEDLSMMEADATAFFSRFSLIEYFLVITYHIFNIRFYLRVDCILAQSKLLLEEHSQNHVLPEHIIPWTDIFQVNLISPT